jgi:hypothetical protein
LSSELFIAISAKKRAITSSIQVMALGKPGFSGMWLGHLHSRVRTPMPCIDQSAIVWTQVVATKRVDHRDLSVVKLVEGPWKITVYRVASMSIVISPVPGSGQ